MSDLPKTPGSVRPITVEGQPGKTWYGEVRYLTTAAPGQIAWVNFAAFGQPAEWRRCELLPKIDAGGGVHVRPAPEPACRCVHGLVCDLHPEEPEDHDPTCPGAGIRCPNPDCPWWKGPRPAAMDLSSEEREPN